jgi:KEOPS complex subunit Pcc1
VLHEASFSITTEYAPVISSSLNPEADSDQVGRTRSQCNRCKSDCLEVHISAEDITALRAALNSWLRLIQIAEEMIIIAKDNKYDIRS